MTHASAYAITRVDLSCVNPRRVFFHRGLRNSTPRDFLAQGLHEPEIITPKVRRVYVYLYIYNKIYPHLPLIVLFPLHLQIWWNERSRWICIVLYSYQQVSLSLNNHVCVPFICFLLFSFRFCFFFNFALRKCIDISIATHSVWDIPFLLARFAFRYCRQIERFLSYIYALYRPFVLTLTND